MAITAIYEYFAPDIAVHMEESFERAGIAPEAIGQSHIDSCFRSMMYMLNSEWTTLGMTQWMIQEYTYTTTVGLNNFLLPAGAIDVYDMTIIRQLRTTPVNRMSRSEWLEIPDKTQQGRPDRWFVDRQWNQNLVWLWRTPENNTDQLQFYYFRQMSQPTDVSNQLQMPPRVLEAFVSGLSAKLALKFNPQKFQLLNTLYLGQAQDPISPRGYLGAALNEDRDRTDTRMTLQLRPRRGGYR